MMDRSKKLVLLHGWAMHSGVWESLVCELSVDFEVHAIDLPGHGASPDLPAEKWVDSLAESFDSEVNLCGWSLGGQIAMEWARRYPERVSRLALVATTPCFVERGDWSHALPKPVFDEFARELENDYEATLKRFISLQARGADDPKALSSQLRRMLFARSRPSVDGLREGLKLLEQNDLRQLAAEISRPVLMIHGERDKLTPYAAGKWLSESVPQAKLHPIPAAAHAPFLSHPDSFANILTGFFNGN